MKKFLISNQHQVHTCTRMDFDLPGDSAVNVENILALSGVSPIKKSKKLGFIIYWIIYMLIR